MCSVLPNKRSMYVNISKSCRLKLIFKNKKISQLKAGEFVNISTLYTQVFFNFICCFIMRSQHFQKAPQTIYIVYDKRVSLYQKILTIIAISCIHLHHIRIRCMQHSHPPKISKHKYRQTDIQTIQQAMISCQFVEKLKKKRNMLERIQSQKTAYSILNLKLKISKKMQ